jgi:uncharacterized protein
MSQLRIDVADLLTHPGSRREVTLRAGLDALRGSASVIDGPVDVVASLERVPDGIVVRGEISARFRAQCSVCLRDIEPELRVHVDELFEPNPIEGETYPLEGHELDLEQLVRDALLLELPLAPHCAEPCSPVDASDASEHPERADDTDDTDETDETDEQVDPRWAPLAELEL